KLASGRHTYAMACTTRRQRVVQTVRRTRVLALWPVRASNVQMTQNANPCWTRNLKLQNSIPIKQEHEALIY
ncbi:hypothetical protein HAX54_028251, partial [Datura stramonium]|nr:hypothetical protein [Datura stramonium]